MAESTPSQGNSWPHVVVIGGGFAGTAVVRELRHTRVKVTLIDQNVYKTFQPLLYQVATAGLNPGDVTMFLRGLRLKQRNMRYRQGRLSHIDQTAQAVTLSDGAVVPYDYLVLANGASTNFFGTPGAENFAMPMYTRSQAIAIRDRIFTCLERVAYGLDEDNRLSVIVVGGGATGVEVAGALADFRIQELDITYPELAGGDGSVEITIVQRGEAVLKPFRKKLRDYAANALRERGVKLRFGHGVSAVSADGVTLDNGEELRADVVIWAAGVSADDEVAHWSLPQQNGGRLEVDAHLRVLGAAGVFAAGDIAGGPDPLPQLAQPAIQGGEHVGKMIRAEVTGEGAASVGPFKYHNKGTMATIGRHAAVAEIPGFVDLTGTPGWLAWIGVHVKSLIGHRNQRATLMNLISLYAGTRRTHQPNPIVGEVQAVTRHRHSK